MNYTENSACPSCWHNPVIESNNNEGIGNYSIAPLVTYKGGILDKEGTCNKCKFNFIQVQNCKNCKPNQPCPVHYAGGYNGTLNTHMPEMMHCLYMRNSPYQPSWYSRPASIGAWYGKQQTSYIEVLNNARRFTEDYRIHAEFNQLEKVLRYSSNVYHDFWGGFLDIYKRLFLKDDETSRAMYSYFQTIRGPSQYPRILK